MTFLTPYKKCFLYLLSITFIFNIWINQSVIAQDSNSYNIKNALVLTINASINPATFSYVKEGYKNAKDNNFDIVIIKINTPGGLVSTTKKILTKIGEQDIPTAIWITPEGASATSAGAIIASSAHFLFMSEGTNVGAATPIQMGGDIKEKDLRSKAINDLVALVQSLAEARGRNGKLFGQMIESAKSFKALEAKELNLIDGILNNQNQLPALLNSKIIHIKGEQFKVTSSNISYQEFKMDFGQVLLNIFANPSMAYILFIIGAALLYLELQAPGGMVAGSIGVLFLILAAISFQILPLNIGALGLIALSFILFVLEAYVTSYGILSIAGVFALTFGSLFLFRTDNAYIAVSSGLIFSTVGGIVAFLGMISLYWLKDSKKEKVRSLFSLEGKSCIITSVLESNSNNHAFQVKVSGEIWKAISNNQYSVGDQCTILTQNKQDLFLEI